MNIKIARCNDEDEKKKLMANLEKFEAGLKSQMKAEVEGQNAKLLKALEARRNRRAKVNEKTSQ